MSALIRLTTVAPAYNEGSRLAAFLEDWSAEALSQLGLVATLVVVDDGSRPEHESIQERAVRETAAALRSGGAAHRVEYVRSPRNRGKGASIRLGWDRAGTGEDWLGFIDADGAVPAREFWRLARVLSETEADAVCGSRVKMSGRSVQRSFFRHLQGRVFATLVEQVFGLGFYDTQCGLKFFRAAALRPLLPELREDRWLLDVELLEGLRASRARCLEVPVDCHQRRRSSLLFGIDSVKIAWRLLALRRRLPRHDGAPR
jgi:dolichyl-phosphate beta-glucosyltransferase